MTKPDDFRFFLDVRKDHNLLLWTDGPVTEEDGLRDGDLVDCFRIGSSPSHGDWMLILKKTEGAGNFYRRVGIAHSFCWCNLNDLHCSNPECVFKDTLFHNEIVKRVIII